jgi:valyl-tRNA synthetase
MKTYTMILPPPNVTGTLHLGHALNNTLQDIFAKYKILSGYDVLWQPGLDHAGIATQMVVERLLDKEGLSRHDLGREEFLNRVWAWKEESGGMICNQQKCLNLSLNWERLRFTMDDEASKAVLKAFVQLYNDGLIYRDKRLVNWDPKLQTAISDLEVINKEVTGNLYYINYKSDFDEGIVVATTRPETLFGDVAVAVNPDDERYQHLIGKYLYLPLTDRKIPVIADDYCDKDYGTGAVKITPAHDFNDFEVGKRHNLTPINILNDTAHLNDNVPKKYQGLHVELARKKVLEDLGDLLIKTETIQQTLPYGDRSNVITQPFLTDQWFVDAKTLAQPAIQAVRDGEIKMIPAHWEKTYFGWLENIEPWCISRQLWWGHQIPAWFGPDEKIFVAENEEAAYLQAEHHYGQKVVLRRDNDVLDTWFSSALWPFVTMGWPKDSEELSLRYPSQTLVTGFDILFFWVARMIMMGLYFMKKPPFKVVYLHALVRDEEGQKMSKSKGNVLDPMDLMNSYGADALRFCLASLCAPGRDIKIGPSKVEEFRNFITKIKNSAKFLEMNACVFDPDFDPKSCQHPLNHWIYKQTLQMIKEVSVRLGEYRFDLAAQSLYHFLWGTFCDVYIECFKAFSDQEEFKKMGAWVFQNFLKILYPFAPETAESLALAPLKQWPDLNLNDCIDNNFEEWLAVALAIRSVRGILNIAPKVKLDLFGDEMDFRHFPWIQSLSRIANWQKSEGKSIPIPVGARVFHLYIGSEIDLGATIALLQKKTAKLEKDVMVLNQKIKNQAYKTSRPENWAQDCVAYENKRAEYEKTKSILSALNSIQ